MSKSDKRPSMIGNTNYAFSAVQTEISSASEAVQGNIIIICNNAHVRPGARVDAPVRSMFVRLQVRVFMT